VIEDGCLSSTYHFSKSNEWAIAYHKLVQLEYQLWWYIYRGDVFGVMLLYFFFLIFFFKKIYHLTCEIDI
jgi:hypothetical protein